jgi:hypothetical protein
MLVQSSLCQKSLPNSNKLLKIFQHGGFNVKFIILNFTAEIIYYMLVEFNHLFVVIKFDKSHSNATAMLMTLFKCLQQKLVTYNDAYGPGS